MIQNLVIMCLIISLSRTSHPALLSLLALAGPLTLLGLILMPSSPIPLPLLQALLTLTIPLALASKIPQILINYRTSSTGQLSSLLVFSSLLGCLARLFTTLAETGDSTLLLNFGSGSALNGILALQMILYWRRPNAHDPSSSSSSYELSPLASSSALRQSTLSSISTTTTTSSSSPQPRINLNKPKQWTRKAD